MQTYGCMLHVMTTVQVARVPKAIAFNICPSSPSCGSALIKLRARLSQIKSQIKGQVKKGAH